MEMEDKDEDGIQKNNLVFRNFTSSGNAFERTRQNVEAFGKLFLPPLVEFSGAKPTWPLDVRGLAQTREPPYYLPPRAHS